MQRRSLIANPIFWVVALLLVGGASAYMYVNQWAPAMKQAQAINKGKVSSAFLAAALKYKKEKGVWAKNKQELLEHPRVKELDASDIAATEYTLKQETGPNSAVYVFTYRGKAKDVQVRVSNAPDKPMSAGFQ